MHKVRQLSSYLSRMDMEGAVRFTFDVATVLKVEAAGMGDRVCVDLCSMLHMGEGMLVGSFSRALFLVHSEVRLFFFFNWCCCFWPTALAVSGAMKRTELSVLCAFPVNWIYSPSYCLFCEVIFMSSSGATAGN